MRKGEGSTRETRSKIEHLDFSKADPRIAEQLNVTLARRHGSMPDGWIGSFRPDEAAAEALASPEWDSNMVTYARALRDMAHQADAVLTEVDDTPENQAAVYSARRALLAEAEMYYDEGAQRPGIGLSATQHWLGQTTRCLDLARDKDFSVADQQRIVIGRMHSIATELQTLLGFVETGGWKNASERERFCQMIAATPDQTNRDTLLQRWRAMHGDPTTFETAWTAFTTVVETYHKKFLGRAAPDRTPILGETGVRTYLEKLGMAETPAEIIEWCEREASALRTELNRLRQAYPEVTQLSYPENDAAVIARAEQARAQYIKHFVKTGLLPVGVDVNTIPFHIRDAAAANDLSFASIASDHSEIHCPPASAQEAWSTQWANWHSSVTHELTHKAQADANLVDKGWKSLEAAEGGAVAMEWLAAAVDSTTTPASMYRLLQLELRRTVGMKLSLQYHREELSDAELAQRLENEAELETSFQRRNNVEGVQNSVLLTGAYWFGPRFIAALAKTEHHGNLRAAVKHLAHATGLRLPGHVLIRGAQLDKFQLTKSIKYRMN
jgi:hypothetical protein